MDVILLKDVAELGGKGDIVDVSNGYARNYLLPKKLAMKATAGAIKQAERLRQQRIDAEIKAKEAAEEFARNLVGSRIVIAAKRGSRSASSGRWAVMGSSTPMSPSSIAMPTSAETKDLATENDVSIESRDAPLK